MNGDSPRAPATHQLVVVRGQATGKSYFVTQAEATLGRDARCEIPVPDENVSRRHARLGLAGRNCWVEDLGSTNHTYVNGERIDARISLVDGDRIFVGETVLEYRHIPSEEPPTRTTSLLHVRDAVSAEHDSDFKPEVKLRALLRISRAVGRTLDLRTLLQQMLDGLFEIFPHANHGLVLLKTSNGLSAEAVKARIGPPEPWRFSRTIVEQVMNERQAVLSEEVSTGALCANAPSIAMLQANSIICAPLLAADLTPLGVVQLTTQEARGKFVAEDVEILLSVAHQMAVSIQYSQLHEEQLNQARLQKELDLAAQMQQAFLPQRWPTVSGYEFWAHYSAAVKVGGDFYDFVKLPGGALAVILGDVCGKGMPAALMMARVSAMCQNSLFASPNDLGAALLSVNEAMLAQIASTRFLTLAACLLKPEEHTVEMLAAGHMSPIVRRANGDVEEPAATAGRTLPLGVSERFPCSTTHTALGPGDAVVIYSDGISEASDANGEMYSCERLLRLLQKTRGMPAAAIGEAILDEVRAHAAASEQQDDITLVVFARQ